MTQILDLFVRQLPCAHPKTAPLLRYLTKNTQGKTTIALSIAVLFYVQLLRFDVQSPHHACAGKQCASLLPV